VTLADALEHAAEVFRAVRRAHDVGMDDERHDARRVGGVGVNLLELVERAFRIFRCLVVLDQHHCDVVAFLCVGHIDNRLASRLEPHRLVVEHPVGDITIAFLHQQVRRFPGFDLATQLTSLARR
jgi:hypothetical protein